MFVGSRGVELAEPSDVADAGGIPFQVTLTDAEAKASPTTPVDLVPAPGAGKMLVLVGDPLLIIDTSAGGYTNLNDAAKFIIGREGEEDGGSSVSDAANKPLQFWTDNAGDGDFTGGNAANSVLVTGRYREVDVSAYS